MLNGRVCQTPRDRFVESAVAAATAPKPLFETGIPMRDGIELAADVYLPEADALPAPAIMTMTPYDKGGLFVAPEGRVHQDHGYADVAVDVRGRGKSEGWRIRWGETPGCNCRAGMTAGSGRLLICSKVEPLHGRR